MAFGWIMCIGTLNLKIRTPFCLKPAFVIIVLNENLPGGKYMSLVVVCTVFFSLIAHGISARPLANWLGRKEGNS